MLAEGRGTCSTKHALLAELLSDRPELELELVHRVYRVDRTRARELFGERAASVVPDGGLIDVHTYATVRLDGRRRILDVTFPSREAWDGRSDMQLQCGDGVDYPAGESPWELKETLVATHCDDELRGRFIAALSDVSAAP